MRTSALRTEGACSRAHRAARCTTGGRSFTVWICALLFLVSSASLAGGEPFTGDCTGDGSIDLADYDSFERCLGNPGVYGCACADLDQDGEVNLGDFAEFAVSFTGGVACNGEVPNSAYCAEVCEWSSAPAAFEEEVVALVNAHRAAGATCGGEYLGPVAPLRVSPELRCAARVHSLDMYSRGYFSHSSPEGEGVDDRVDSAGYRWWWLGENIARGYRTPQAVVAGWMNSPGHCANIMRSNYRDTGVGYVASGYYWTQVFASPR